MSNLWWHIYDPVIITKEHPEQMWANMDHEFFYKNVTVSPLGQKLGEKHQAIQVLTAMEFLWIKSAKPTFFIADGIVDFVRNTRTDHTANVFGQVPIFSISWHPSEHFKKCQLPPVLIAPRDDRITIQWQDLARKGTETAFIPKEVPLSEIKEMMSPLGMYLAQTTLGVMTYMQAFPELVIPGLPSDIKLRCVKYFGKGRVSYLKLHDKIRSAPSAHLRCGHWRTLRHEKFKRNKNGSVRIVYVNPAIVGFITPYTVEIEGAES